MVDDTGFDNAATARGEIDARPHAVGGRFAIDGLELDAARPGRAIVGKSPACDLVVDDPLVSRRHLALEVEGSVLRLTDLGSTNGTRVNGLRVIDAMLEGGESIEIGSRTLHVRVLEREKAIPLLDASSFGKVLGESDAMRRLYPLCARLAATDVPVVIEGETGTGKEVLAEALHEMGPRRNGPFIVFDCTTVAPSLVESALFGYDRGAYTGAVEGRPGVFEQAHGGTLLIDEIGDLDLALQGKLLRALERREVKRVGGTSWISVDVRVLAATRRDLEREVQDGRFRDDLFYRLAVTRIELPPLRARHGDVRVLAQAFWKRLATDGSTAPPDFLAQLERQRWTGNVRELHHAVARRVALGDLASEAGGARGDRSTGDPIADVLDRKLPFSSARAEVIARFEERYVARLVADHDGNVARAAEASGLARRYFQLLRARSKGRLGT